MLQSHCGALGLSNPTHKLCHLFTNSNAEVFISTTAHAAEAIASARGAGLDWTQAVCCVHFQFLYFFMKT